MAGTLPCAAFRLPSKVRELLPSARLVLLTEAEMPERDIETLKRMPHETRGNPLENEPQVDPMLQEGRASGFRMWMIGIGIAVVLALVMYGVGTQHTQTARIGAT